MRASCLFIFTKTKLDYERVGRFHKRLTSHKVTKKKVLKNLGAAQKKFHLRFFNYTCTICICDCFDQCQISRDVALKRKHCIDVGILVGSSPIFQALFAIDNLDLYIFIIYFRNRYVLLIVCSPIETPIQLCEL